MITIIVIIIIIIIIIINYYCYSFKIFPNSDWLKAHA